MGQGIGAACAAALGFPAPAGAGLGGVCIVLVSGAAASHRLRGPGLHGEDGPQASDCQGRRRPRWRPGLIPLLDTRPRPPFGEFLVGTATSPAGPLGPRRLPTCGNCSHKCHAMRIPLRAFVLLSLGAASALAQTPTPTKTVDKPKARAPWELEWAYLSKYHDADARLGPPGPGESRVVFYGDSITEYWGTLDGGFFAAKPYVNRGIGGQTTSQLLVRFRQDVLGLRPAAVVILGGTNDIAQNGGMTTVEAIEENLQSMVELARVNRIRVVLASVLPALDYPWRPGLKPRDKITESEPMDGEVLPAQRPGVP